MKRQTDIETTKWYKNTMALVAMAGALAGGLYGLVEVVRLFEPKKVMENVEIVLDGSAVMNEPLGDGTKWDAAMRAVKETLSLQVAEGDNLAFRVFGGSCLGESSELLLDFRQDNKEKVLSALEGIAPEGEPAVASAILEASGDFNDPARFEGVNKTIIVITGSSDPCHPDAMTYLADRLQNKGDIKTSWHYIGIGLDHGDAAKVKEIAEATGGRTFFPTNPDDVVTVVTRLGDPDDPGDEPPNAPTTTGGRVPQTRPSTPRVDDVEEPKKIHDVRPVYPPDAQRAQRGGVVSIEATIDERGNVTNARVISSRHTSGRRHESGGVPLLEQAALDAVLEWKYEPAIQDGKPVPFKLTVEVKFGS